jgi:hypothetical protein
MTPPDAPRLTAKAAALLIGGNPRTVQGWFVRAGHKPGKGGYPLPVVAQVLADHDAPVPDDVLEREAATSRLPRRRAHLSPPSSLAVPPGSALERRDNDARMALETLRQQQEAVASIAANMAALRDDIAALRADIAALAAKEEAPKKQRRWWQRK